MPDYGVMWAQLRSDMGLRADDLAEQIKDAREQGDYIWMHDRIAEREAVLSWEIIMDEMEENHG